MSMLSPRLQLRVAQKQILTPGLVQMVTVLQLKAIELEDRHHLDESGRQDLLLRDSQLQSGRKH